MKLAVEAPGKVNLCLFLGPLRDDGRHELVTVIESVSLSDRLAISTAQADQVHCPKIPEPNLVSVTLEKLRAKGWNGPPLAVQIEKRVPVAAGMGGGSADAAALLRVAHHLRPLSDSTLYQLAAEIGADVASQLQPGLTLATGAGERVQPLPALEPHAFVIVPQPYPLATAEVYAEADRLGLRREAAELEDLCRRVRDPSERPPPVNDLGRAALSLAPELEQALEATDQAGVDHTLVSGSGPTVVGLFWGPEASQRANESAQQLCGRFPGTVPALPVGADAGRVRALA